jgi:phosphatidylglycerol:prolipoprotein diacylglycerol transferase
MRPTLFKIGPISIHSYGLMVAIAFLVAIFVAANRAKKEGIPAQNIFDLGLYILVSAFLGARIFHFFQHLEDYSSFWEVFRVWEGGLSYYGGFISAFIVSIIYLQINKLSIERYLDILGPSMILGLSIGRVGCFLAGCCFGKETSLPWGIPSRWTLLDSGDVYVHPTQIYSSVSLFTIFVVLIILRKYMRFSGQLFLLTVIMYSGFRFLIDFIRFYTPEERMGILATSQVLSIILGTFALIIMIVFILRHRKKYARIKIQES